jgi:secreted PhoX family phosphatase
MKRIMFVAAAVATALSAGAADFGQKVEALAKSQAFTLFGVAGTLGASSSLQRTAAELEANPASALTVAPGLSVRVVSAAANLAPNMDQMVLWPDDVNPTHLIACNEQGGTEVAVQRITLATGAVENILAAGTAAAPGMSTCDPVRKTPWGTIIVGEETGGGGRLFEILDPLATTNVTVTGSGAATTTSDPAHVQFLPNVGTLSWEGLALLPNGVMYMTDESRPGAGVMGGGMFKFIPTNLWTGGAAITNLAASPFASGRLFGLRVGRNSTSSPDFGQANEYGRGYWVEVTGRADVGAAPINLRNAGVTLKLTGYYRPEDAEFDLKELAAGNVRFCGTNTGQDVPDTNATGDNHWGEVYCLRDGTVANAAVTTTATQAISGVSYTVLTSTTPEYQTLVLGNRDFAMMDNLAYHPKRGFFVLNEDGEGPTYSAKRNNDIWACLDDGEDADKTSDACVKLMTLNDLTAETTGGLFDATGTRYFVSVQHNLTGHGIILEVNGWL